MKFVFFLPLILSITAGCAARPDSIPASFVSHEKYAGRDCNQLSIDMSNARNELQKYSQLQNSKANTDAATVFFILVPTSKLSGDHAADVAKWKGEVEAVETALIRAGCRR